VAGQKTADNSCLVQAQVLAGLFKEGSDIVKKNVVIISLVMLAVLMTTGLVVAQAQEPVEEWVAKYKYNGELSGMAVDTLGNVYVTGMSFNGYNLGCDYVTVKYDTNGYQQWIKRYGGVTIYKGKYAVPGLGWAKAIAADSSGNVYVTGYSSGDNPNPDYADYTTIKYDTDGNELWLVRYQGPGNLPDHPIAMAVDMNGNAYVTGFTYQTYSNLDYATVKYNSAGVEQWVQTYNGPVNGEDKAVDIAIDASGNVYVTGSSKGSDTANDYITIKYDSQGVQQWVQRFNGPNNQDDFPTSIAVDSLGNVYVTGGSNITTNMYGPVFDYVTVKYDNKGIEQWVKEFRNTGLSSLWYMATDIAIDSSGNLYIAGPAAILKYDTNGNLLWMDSYQRIGNVFIATDKSDNIYVTGPNLATYKYGSNGAEQWTKKYGLSGDEFCFPRAIALDTSSNVYVALEAGGDCIIIKYSQSEPNYVQSAPQPEPNYEQPAPHPVAPDAQESTYHTDTGLIVILIVIGLVVGISVVLILIFRRRPAKKPSR
jgi:hypothetical protein